MTSEGRRTNLLRVSDNLNKSVDNSKLSPEFASVPSLQISKSQDSESSSKFVSKSRTLSTEETGPQTSKSTSITRSSSFKYPSRPTGIIARHGSLRVSRDSSSGGRTGSVSNETGEAGTEDKKGTKLIRKVSIRRRISRDGSRKGERPEVILYGNCPDDYKNISERVRAEKAVVNAIEALQERWKMLMFMYEDCMDMDKEIKERRMYKRKVKRQEEIIIFVFIASVICVPFFAVMLFFICR